MENNNTKITKLLLDQGADINVRCTNEIPFNKLGLRYECLFRGFYFRHNKRNFLYMNYCDKPVCHDGMNILEICARQGLWKMAKYLISKWNANFIAKNNFNVNIIEYAAIFDHVNFILRFHMLYPLYNSTLSIANGKKRLLKIIVACGSIETLRLFYNENNNDSFSEHYDQGKTLLHLSTSWSPYPANPGGLRGLDSFFKQIFSCTDILNNNGYELALREDFFPWEAVKREYDKRLKVVKLLTKFGKLLTKGNIDTRDAEGRTALHYAALNGFVGAVRHLVREGSDWKMKDKYGNTPLMMALEAAPLNVDFHVYRMGRCKYSNISNHFQSCRSTAFDHTVSYLISLHKASLSKCNEETRYILHLVILKKLHLSLYNLFGNGIDVHCGDGLKFHFNETLFSEYHIAEMNEVFKIFKIDVKETCGVRFTQSEIHVMTYLGMPSEIGNFFKPSYNNISFPLQRLIDQNSKGFKLFDECYDKEGYLPIHRAVQGGNIDAIQWFLDLGVDIWRKTKSGWTALDLAIYLLVPKRFGTSDLKLEQYSKLNSFYTILHLHHSSLYKRYCNNARLTDFRKCVIIRNIREKVFEILFEKAFKTNSFERSPILQSWCKKDSTELSALHIAASLGMEMLSDIHMKLQSISHKYPLKCYNKHNIEPMYLAFLYNSVEAHRTLQEIFLQKNIFEKLTTEYPANLKYPDREAEYHLIYNYLYKTPDEELLSKFDVAGLFECKGINDFLPDIETLDVKVEQCYDRCWKSVSRARDLFSSTFPRTRVSNLMLFNFQYFYEHLDETRYYVLKMFYKVSSKLWRHVSEAYKCSYQCRCTEGKKNLLFVFTGEQRRNRKVGEFVAKRMGWSNTSLNGDVQYRWPFKFLLNKALRKDKAFDYLKIFGDTIKSNVDLHPPYSYMFSL